MYQSGITAPYPDVHQHRKTYNKYHSAIKLFIASGGNPVLARDLSIPKSTVHAWKQADFSKIITHPLTGSVKNELFLFQRFVENQTAKKLFRCTLRSLTPFMLF